MFKLLEEEAKEHLKEIAQADKKKPEFEQIVQKRKPGLDYECMMTRLIVTRRRMQSCVR